MNEVFSKHEQTLFDLSFQFSIDNLEKIVTG